MGCAKFPKICFVLGEDKVPGSFGHHHSPVVSQGSRNSTEHQDEPPRHVSLRRGGICRRRPRRSLEYGAHDDGDGGAGQDSEALHREHGRYEGATCLLVSKLRHNSGGERVVAAYAQAQHEPEESQREEHARARGADGEAARQGPPHHQHEGQPVHASPPDSIAQPAEHHLADGGAEEGDGQHGGDDERRRKVAVGVVEAAEDVDDESDGEEVVCVCEHSHACYYDGFEVVVLRPRRVQCRQHLQPPHYFQSLPHTHLHMYVYIVRYIPVRQVRGLKF